MSTVVRRLAGMLLCVLPVATVAAPAAPATPAAADATQARLQRLDAFLERSTGADGYLGGVALVARDGERLHWKAYGSRDLARSAPMAPDSIFRIYSMSKTVATVAVLMLMEEGRLGIDDPVADYLPAFGGLQVSAPGGSGELQLRAPATPLTIRHLLTHTAGFSTRSDDPAFALLEQQDLHGARDLEDFAQRVARVPLAADPGTRFAYDGTQIEVAGRIVEVVSGQRFDAFLRERIFVPLDMHDTGFEVPQPHRHRVVDLTRMGGQGRLVIDGGPSALQPGAALNPYPSGAGGLYSTARDFHRFAQMLLDGGRLEGKRLLGRKTVEFMMTNHLTRLDPPVTSFSDAEGFGLGGSVLLDPARRGRLGSAGQFGWSGAASTYFTIDPKERLVAILLLQHLPNDAPGDLPRLSTRFYNLVYQSIE